MDLGLTFNAGVTDLPASPSTSLERSTWASVRESIGGTFGVSHGLGEPPDSYLPLAGLIAGGTVGALVPRSTLGKVVGFLVGGFAGQLAGHAIRETIAGGSTGEWSL